ncbi:hypothetical protein ACQGAO_07705 [Rhodococcus sp. 1.20]
MSRKKIRPPSNDGSAANPVTIPVPIGMPVSVELAEYHHNVPFTRLSALPHRSAVSATRAANHWGSVINTAGTVSGYALRLSKNGTATAIRA